VVPTLSLSKARNDPNAERVTELMKESVGRWVENFALLDRLGNRFRTRSTTPIGVAFFVPMFLHTADLPAPFFYSHLALHWQENSADVTFTTAFVRACNRVLGFRGTEKGEATLEGVEVTEPAPGRRP
jgi:hypothetical protein